MEKMREIKFKFWFNKRGSFIRYYDYAVKQDGTVMIKEEKDGLWFECVKGSFDVLQYTGLKDKNGKEIYEGDIVNVLNYLNGEIWEGHTHHDEVVFLAGRFNIKKPWCHESLQSSAVEVIGNIYEDKELLGE